MSYNKYWSMVIDNICIFILKKKEEEDNICIFALHYSSQQCCFLLKSQQCCFLFSYSHPLIIGVNI